ncbi:transposase [Streptomyces sp. Qhu-G9]|uniref:transposase n=1 Tax=Streptomyces sp. Qhu-G9 TaxID=3452799 RepID=UPI003AF8F7BB
MWKFRTGTAWRDVPERYGPRHTLHTRFRRCALDGSFERMLRAAQAQAHAAGDIDWLLGSGGAGGHRAFSSASGTGEAMSPSWRTDRVRRGADPRTAPGR